MFAFGHVWVVLAVVVSLPFTRRAFALPLLIRLYRTKQECARSGERYRKKTELARELLEVVARWARGQRCGVAADAAYCNDTVTRGLARHVVLFGRMRPDAVLSAAPAQVARPAPGRAPASARRAAGDAARDGAGARHALARDTGGL